jgi:hypothetical protein
MVLNFNYILIYSDRVGQFSLSVTQNIGNNQLFKKKNVFWLFMVFVDVLMLQKYSTR